MADYIDKNILCEAYLHIEVDGLTVLQQEAYIEELRDFATKRARFFLYEEIDLQLTRKEGSLTVYVTILGTLRILYKAIGEYPKFREGAIAAFEDVKRFAESVISEGLFRARVRRKGIVRLEARTGVVGSLRKVVGLLELIKGEDGAKSVRWMTSRLQESEDQIRLLINNLRTQVDREFVMDGFLGLAQQLPATPAPRRRRQHSRGEVEAYASARARLITYLSSAHRATT